MPAAPFAEAALVLVRTQGPVNLGMVCRLCGNFGIEDLRLVDPLCDLQCDDSRKFATSNRDLLARARVFPDLPAALADRDLAVGTSGRSREEDRHGRAVDPAGLPALLAGRSAGRWALVFGNEADGLSEAELFACQGWLHLPTWGPQSSYNLSHAVAIACFSLAQEPVPPEPLPPAEAGAPRATVDRLFTYWMNSLERFRYFRRTDPERFEPILRRTLNRLHMTEYDANLFMGMLAQFNYHAFGDKGDADDPQPR